MHFSSLEIQIVKSLSLNSSKLRVRVLGIFFFFGILVFNIEKEGSLFFMGIVAILNTLYRI